jgi:streptomycin 3"-adenylyltransferase
MPHALGSGDREQLGRVVALLRDVLADDVAGAFLFGSAVLGGLRPESDLDVLAVSRRPITGGERRRLVERLLSVSGGRGRRVELTIVVESEVRPWRYPPGFDFQYGDWLRDAFERGDLEPWETRVSPDLAALITMALLADTPLLGPRPAEVLDPVPHDDLVRAMVDDLDRLLVDLPWDGRNVVLTLARIWSTIETGAIRPKDEAADWALPRLGEEHRAVLARARAMYLGEADDRWDGLESRIRPYVDAVTAEIHRSRERR